MTDEFTYIKTPRGFQLIEFQDRYDKLSSIQESSLASEACLWIGQGEERIHLTQAQAKKVIKILKHFVKTGYLPESESTK